MLAEGWHPYIPVYLSIQTDALWLQGHRRAYSVLQVFDVPGFILKNMVYNLSRVIDFSGRAAKYRENE